MFAPQPDWEKVCGPVKDQQEVPHQPTSRCGDRQALAQFMIIERGDKKRIQVAVPPVALIQPGIQIKIDQGQPTGVKVRRLHAWRCPGARRDHGEFVSSLKGGGNLIITMLNPQGKPVNFDIGLAASPLPMTGRASIRRSPARQQKLEDELKKKADAARQQLSTPSSRAAPPSNRRSGAVSAKAPPHGLRPDAQFGASRLR
jgi:hypothetical protein